MTRRTIVGGTRLALLLMVSMRAPGAAQASPYWGDLEPGPHDVGFRSEWLLDFGRSYRATFDDGSSYGGEKAPRPLLVNLWYPAPPDPSAPRMRHRDYLSIESDDPDLAAFAAALRRYNLEVIAREVTGLELDELDDPARARFEATLDARTVSRRGAPVAEGRFPVVIYHAGHGSSFEDNAVLCELLASHGYIVIGSAFQHGDGSGLGTDTDAGSIADIDALVRFARGLDHAEWSRIALIGHSGGAQLGFRYAARPGSAIDAFVSLDTTEDYYGLSATFWSFPAEVLENRDHVTVPILVAANSHAVFLLADSLASADRYYLTVRDVAHNEFISQGLMASDFEARSEAADADAPAPSPTPADRYRGDPGVMERYASLVTIVRRFLDGQLKGDRIALSELRRDLGSSPLGGSAPHLEYVPKGTTAAPAYSDPADGPPTPRQLRPLIERLGLAETIGILERWTGASPSPVLDEPTFAVALLWEYVLADRLEEARRLYAFFARIHENMIGEFLRWYDVFSAMGDDGTAEDWLEIAEALDPTHPDVRARSGGR